jgi:hypothetical protein
MSHKISKKLRSKKSTSELGQKPQPKTRKFWQSPAWKFGITIGATALLISIVLFGNQISNLFHLRDTKASGEESFTITIIDPLDKTRTVFAGEKATYTIKVASVDGLTGDIGLQCSDLELYPNNIDSAIINPASLHISPNTPGFAELTIRTKLNGGAEEGIKFRITAKLNGVDSLIYEKGLLNITDFSITVNSQMSPNGPSKTIPGRTLVFDVTVNRSVRFTGNIYATHNLLTRVSLNNTRSNDIKSVIWGNAIIDPAMGIFFPTGSNTTTLTITLKNPVITMGLIDFEITATARLNGIDTYRKDTPPENSSFEIIALRCTVPSSSKPARHTMIITNPGEYTDADILYFANQGVDVINWVSDSFSGIRMTPVRDRITQNYSLSQSQKDLILKLYCSGERIFWIGLSNYHIDIYFPQELGLNRIEIYAETAKAIKAFTDYFAQANLLDAKVGIYTGTSKINDMYDYHGFYTDEAIGWMHNPHPDWIDTTGDGIWDWDDQFMGAIESRQGVMNACNANSTWDKVAWFIAGMNDSLRYNLNPDDLTCPAGSVFVERSEDGIDPPGELHTLCHYYLPNDINSYWAHYTKPGDQYGHEYEISIGAPINLVYVHNEDFTQPTWQNKWWRSPACINGCKTLAWSDKPDPLDPTLNLTYDNNGKRELTRLGKLAFFGATGASEIAPIIPQPIQP